MNLVSCARFAARALLGLAVRMRYAGRFPRPDVLPSCSCQVAGDEAVRLANTIPGWGREKRLRVTQQLEALVGLPTVREPRRRTVRGGRR